MRKKSLILALTVALSGCGENAKETQVRFSPVVIQKDTVRETMEQKWLDASEYEIRYVGKSRDTIAVDTVTGIKERLTHFERSEKTGVEVKMKITVDTTRIISHTRYYRTDNDGKTLFRGYPVIIRNTGRNSYIFAADNMAPLYLEAKDRDGKWKQIEKRFSFGCGTGLRYLPLRPGEVVVTSVPVYKGRFSTFLRLRTIDSIYSNEFRGNINLTQFLQKPRPESGWEE